MFNELTFQNQSQKIYSFCFRLHTVVQPVLNVIPTECNGSPTTSDDCRFTGSHARTIETSRSPMCVGLRIRKQLYLKTWRLVPKHNRIQGFKFEIHYPLLKVFR
jgi:deoxycytidylate deaminase